MHAYDQVEIFKGDELYKTIEGTNEDVTLYNLSYGDYKARLFYSGHYSDFTYWKVVNTSVTADMNKGRLYFHSENAKPIYVNCRDIAGLMEPLPTSNCYCFYIFEDNDIQNGYVDIENIKIRREDPYVRVYFLTEYGTIINKPINWFE